MKKLCVILASVLIAATLFGCSSLAGETEHNIPAPDATPAPASPAAPAEPVLWSETDISTGVAKPTAFAGDGVIEELRIDVNEEAYYTDVTAICGGKEYAYRIDAALAFPRCCYGDTQLDDGFVEVYLMGDTGSCDFYTYVFRVENDTLRVIEYFGTALGVDGSGTVKMDVVVDILGTYNGECTCELTDGFELKRTSDYTITDFRAEGDERYIVIARDELPVRDIATDNEDTLAKGIKVLLVETDEATYATVALEDGTLKRITVTAGESYGWQIAGVDESEWFEELHYAG